MIRKGQYLYHKELDRYAIALEPSRIDWHIKGKVGKVGIHINSRVYPITIIQRELYRLAQEIEFRKEQERLAKLKEERQRQISRLGFNLYGSLIDEANFMGRRRRLYKPDHEARSCVKVRWLDGRTQDATWPVDQFEPRTPLQALAACAD